jgi:hypothetical protein
MSRAAGTLGGVSGRPAPAGKSSGRLRLKRGQWIRLGILGLIVASCVAVPRLRPRPKPAGPPCDFKLGFAAMRDMIGPTIVGPCIENEHFNQQNGNAEQRTTKGLLVWRKADNWMAFTDGHTTWVNGPQGALWRYNWELYCFEAGADPEHCKPVPRPG